MTITILRPCTVFGPGADNYVSRMLFRRITAGLLDRNPRVQLVLADDFRGRLPARTEEEERRRFQRWPGRDLED